MKGFLGISLIWSGWLSDWATSGNAVSYTFQYRYDRCGRLISKKIPGCEPVTYRYDPYGRVAFMQDGNMRDAGRTMFTLYDEFSRVAVTGMCDDDAMAGSVSIPSMTTVLDNSLTFPGICNTGYLAPSPELFLNAELLTAAYYDDYDFLGLDAFSALPQENTSSYASAKGLATGTLTAVLGSDSSTPPIAAVTYYDNEERPVKTLSTTHIAGSNEQTVTTYTLDGQPKTVSHTLKKGGITYIDSYNYTYDNIARLSDVSISVPWHNESFSICADTYNSIGQLIKSVSGGSATTYSYDIRGAVSSLQNDAVNQIILRNANGSIMAMLDNGVEHGYEYDNAGRLLSETCRSSRNGIFSSAYTYDRNSNITTLTRYGYPTGQTNIRGLVDDLTMTYDGNRLVKVTDNADEVLVEKSFDFHDGAERTTEYLYDKNGNVTHDYNRGITEISYNAVNLPSRIDIIGDRSVEYIYDASGRKLSCLIKEADNYLVEAAMFSLPDGSMLPEPNRTVSSREYIGAYEFENGELLRLNTPYGYCTLGSYIPYRRDYQGNNRNNADYYAYGLPVQGSNVSDQDPYLYGGKEFYSVKGINIYDFNARTYAPDIARFMQPDPKAGDYHWLSPYTFCASDPINNIDPDGKNIAILLARDGFTHLAMMIQDEEGVWKYFL